MTVPYCHGPMKRFAAFSFLLCYSLLGHAATLALKGSVGYSHMVTSVIVAADNVSNTGATPSGQVRLELWATPAPYTGSFTGGYQLAQYPIGSIAAGASVLDISSPLLPWTNPPAGTWYVAMVVTEYDGGPLNGGFSSRSYANFPTTIVGSGSPPPPPPPPPPPTDTTPPSVSIASPTGGSVAGTVTVAASASDNVGVTRVDFYVNGSLAGSTSGAPYQYAWNTTALANGAATLKAVAVDAAGNSGQSSTVTVTIANVVAPPPPPPPPPADTTPPSVAITSPSGSVSGTVTVTANASDNVAVSRVDFFVNGTFIGSDGSAPYSYPWNTTGFPNGAATLRATAYDSSGNSTQSAAVVVTIANVVAPPADTSPPAVSIAAPTGGTVAGTVTVTANATDNVGVARVDFYVNGAFAGSSGAAPYQYAWNTAALANGPATLYVRAFDAAGNAAQSAAVAVTVANVVAPPPDTSPPAVSIASPTGGNVAGVVTVSANATDNVGVARVDFYVNGSLVGSSGAMPYQYAWNTTGIANGPATLFAKAFDTAGNSAQSATVAVTVANVVSPPADVSPPVVTLLSPNSGSVSGQVSIAGSAADNVGVARVDLLINSVVVGSVAKAPWNFTWNSRSVGNGAAQIQLAAVDAAGNRGTSATVTVIVANNGGGKPRKLAVEYYNAQLDHYFLTAMDNEVIALDAGRFDGWSRTGFSLDVYDAGTGDGSPVCRFYMPPEYGDSHFYSATPTECSEVAHRFPGFSYESTEVFRVDTPDLTSGRCPQDTVPVYRLWNNRIDSNHRYTADRLVRDEMIAKGYIIEGYGADPVIMCASP